LPHILKSVVVVGAEGEGGARITYVKRYVIVYFVCRS